MIDHEVEFDPDVCELEVYTLNHYDAYLHLLFLFEIFFWCGSFLKSLLNLLQYCFCFMFHFFGLETCGILAPQPGIKPIPPALEGEVLSPGLPGSPPSAFVF